MATFVILLDETEKKVFDVERGLQSSLSCFVERL